MQQPSATDIRPRGRVARFNTARAFGLIQPQTGGPVAGLVFFHANDVDPRGALPPGTLVSFELEPRSDGEWRAVRVREITAENGT